MNERTEPWTSRRRLLTALDCGVPDRVPINTSEMFAYPRDWCWQARQPSYARLMQRLRQDTDCIAMWGPYCPRQDQDKAYGVLVEKTQERHGNLTQTTTTCHTPQGDLRCIDERSDDVATTWHIEPWCKSLDDVDRMLAAPWEPIVYDGSSRERVHAEMGEHGLTMASYGDPAVRAAQLMNFQDALLWVHEHTEHFARTVATIAERLLVDFTRFMKAGLADLYRVTGAEYFTAPYLPRRFFERFVLPYDRQMIELIHAAGAKARLHCHGNTKQVLDLILETGCDAIDPCESPPDGDIELDEVKRRCAARRVCVFGNIELRLLESQTPADIRRFVRRAMEQAKAGGGFVLMPTASPIDRELSPKTEANYMAMIDAAMEFGAY